MEAYDQEAKRKQLIKIIHVKKNALNFSDELYRSTLSDNIGKTSTKDMTLSELRDTLAIFDYIQTGKPIPKKGMINKRQLSFLNDLCSQKGITNAVNYVSAVIHKPVHALEDLTGKDAGMVIRALQRKKR
jgi:phosphoribosylaminoimidazole-succinocarboxamide synthase